MEFKERVWNAIKSMKRYNYTPTVFINMIIDHGEVEAVRRLINSLEPSSGFKKLCELKALNLSMEAIIQEEEWKDIFLDDEREKARKRLNEFEYFEDENRIP